MLDLLWYVRKDTAAVALSRKSHPRRARPMWAIKNNPSHSSEGNCIAGNA
ncbi:hypothetical protein RB213_009713 [Colletotrichum asianum]